MYKGQDYDVNGVALQNALICHRDLPEDFVYEISKMLLDGSPDCHSPGTFVRYHATGGAFTPEWCTSGRAFSAPLHAGMVRYLKERGCWSDEAESFQKKLLSITGEKQ